MRIADGPTNYSGGAQYNCRPDKYLASVAGESKAHLSLAGCAINMYIQSANLLFVQVKWWCSRTNR